MPFSSFSFDVTISEGFGYFRTYDKALRAIQSHQEGTGMRYCLAWCRKKEFDHSNIRDDPMPYKIFWSDGGNTKIKSCHMKFDGIPYLIAGSRIYDCQFGVDRNLNKKRRYKEAMMRGKGIPRRRQKRCQGSKKQNCPAVIYLREIVKFPEFIVPANTAFHRKKGSAKLQKAIKDGNACGETRVYVHFPAASDHANHSLVLGGRSTVDPRIKSKIEEMVQQGIVNISSIREKLTQYVQTEIFEWEKWPEKSNLRFYPQKSYIKNQVNNIMIQQRISQIDLGNVETKVESWQKHHTQDKIFFRHCMENLGDGKNHPSITSPQMLFLIQTEWQRQLLEWHGREQCVLNAAYKSVSSSFPVYFLLTKTKIDYQVVGSFIVMNDTTEAITEALTMFRSWNPNWNPPVVMCGLSEAEMTAVEQVITNTEVLMCDYQREHAWEYWLTDKKNNMATTREQVLYHLRRLAHAASPHEFQEAEEDFFRSNTWLKLRRLQLWFKKIWQPQYQQWVWHHRPEGSNTYDGVEALNKTLRYYFRQLPSPRPPFSLILTIILDHFLPALCAKHIEGSVDHPQDLDVNHSSECFTPSREHPNRSSNDDDIGHKCRELADHIRCSTYLMKDQAALQGLYNSLLVACENILQHNRNQKRITVEGMEEEGASLKGKRESWTRAETLAQTSSPELVASGECRIIGKVVVGQQQCQQDTLEGDIVGSYVVCDNVLELVKPQLLPTQKQKMEDEELQFPFSPKVYKKYQNNPPKSERTARAEDLKVEEKNRRITVEGESRTVEKKRIGMKPLEKNTSALERLKYIPPEVFKLLMPVDEKPKPSHFSAEIPETKNRAPSRTFRILLPTENRHGQGTDSFTTFAVESPERKRQKVSDRNDVQSCTRVTRSVQFPGIHQNNLTSEKRERTSVRIIISGKEKF